MFYRTKNFKLARMLGGMEMHW